MMIVAADADAAVATMMSFDFQFLSPIVVDYDALFQLVPMMWVETMHTKMPAVKTTHNCWHPVNKLHRDVLLHPEMLLQMDCI